MSKKNNNGAGGRKPLADPKGAERRIRAWLLRTCPEEKPMIGDFRKDVTFAEVNRRMHGGENFYDICDCSESVQREIVFRELARPTGPSTTTGTTSGSTADPTGRPVPSGAVRP